MAPSAVNNGARALEGLLARWHKDINGSVATTGSADTYVMAANQTLSAYYDGLMICVDINATNTGASTINVDGLGAKSILKHNDQALAAGDLEANGKYLMIYDGTSFQLLSALANAPAVITADNSFSADQTIASTDAGATEGPALDLHRNSASPAANDKVGVFRGSGENDASEKTTYYKIAGTIDTVTDGSEDGHGSLVSMQAGTLAERFHWGLGFYADGNTDPGAGGIDADAMYQSAERVEATKLDTEQATTSGNSVTFTSPFTTTTRAVVMFDGVSKDGTTDEIAIRIGPTGGLETTGYDSAAGWPGVDATEFLTTGFQVSNDLAVGEGIIGKIDLTLMDSANNTWISEGKVWPGGTTNSFNVSTGVKSLAGVLTQLAVLISGTPTDAFDAGAVNVRWYGY